VADDTKDALVQKAPKGTLHARIRGPVERVESQLRELFPSRTVAVVEREGDTALYSVDCGDSRGPVEESLSRLVLKNEWGLLELGRQRGSLEDVFRSLTLEASKEAMNA